MTKGKKLIALGMYESGRLEVFFNPRADGVIVPEHIKGHVQAKFDYGTEMPIPIPDLSIDDTGISATLSFDRVPFKTFLPWAAVFLMMTGTADMQSNAVWPKDVPRTLVERVDEDKAEEAQAVAGGTSAGATAPAKRERPAWLTLVD